MARDTCLASHQQERCLCNQALRRKHWRLSTVLSTVNVGNSRESSPNRISVISNRKQTFSMAIAIVCLSPPPSQKGWIRPQPKGLRAFLFIPIGYFTVLVQNGLAA